MEAGARLEHEEGGCLLHEQADYDDTPLDVRAVLRRRPKAELEHKQAEDGDCAVTIFRALSAAKGGSMSGYIYIYI